MKLPPYSTFPTISGERIILRQIQPSDLPSLLEISYYDALQASDIEEAAAMQEKIHQDYEKGNSIHWAIADKGTQQIVGTCGFYRGFANDKGELGCILLSRYRGQGFMTDALQAAIDLGLQHIGLKRIWAGTSDDNHAAKKLLEKLGFILINTRPDGEAVYELAVKP